MTIQVWQDRSFGIQYAVEINADGNPVQAMQLNGPRDEEYVLKTAAFGDAGELSGLLSDPNRYRPTARVLQAASPVAAATAAVAADSWTRPMTSQRMAALNNLAVQPAYKNPDGKFNFAKLEAALGFSLKDLQAARKRHGL